MGRNRLPDNTRLGVGVDIEQGELYVKEIAKKWGIAQPTVRRIAKELGLKPKVTTPGESKRISQYIRDGVAQDIARDDMAYVDIAHKWRVSVSSVYNFGAEAELLRERNILSAEVAEEKAQKRNDMEKKFREDMAKFRADVAMLPMNNGHDRNWAITNIKIYETPRVVDYAIAN